MRIYVDKSQHSPRLAICIYLRIHIFASVRGYNLGDRLRPSQPTFNLSVESSYGEGGTKSVLMIFMA